MRSDRDRSNPIAPNRIQIGTAPSLLVPLARRATASAQGGEISRPSIHIYIPNSACIEESEYSLAAAQPYARYEFENSRRSNLASCGTTRKVVEVTGVVYE